MQFESADQQKNSGRVHRRHRLGENTSVYVATHESCITLPARVLDVSAGGIALILEESLPVGDEVYLQIVNRDSDRTEEIAGHVANVRQQRSGRWVIGLAFDHPLTTEQLDQFL